MNGRLEKVRSALDDLALDSLVVTKLENVRYLSGFSGSSAVAVLTRDGTTLVTDGRYREQAARESAGWETMIYAGDVVTAAVEALGGSSSIGFEVSASFDFHRKLTDALAPDVTLKPTEGLIERLRCFKDESEVELIRASIDCAGTAFSRVRRLIKPGATERQLAAELDYRMMLAGAESPGFDTVLASGPNSSMPHAGITDRELAEGDLVVIDFGATKDGYSSDITRTVILGEPSERPLQALEAVRGANRAAIAALRPGVAASEIFGVAFKYLEEKGFSEYFSHGLGHGVGLEVHEKPSVSMRSDDTLEPGMVFTIEPGVYVEGLGGARSEDMVLMTQEGAEVLTSGIE